MGKLCKDKESLGQNSFDECFISCKMILNLLQVIQIMQITYLKMTVSQHNSLTEERDKLKRVNLGKY